MLVTQNRFQAPQRQNFGAKIIAKEPVKKMILEDQRKFFHSCNQKEKKNYFGSFPLEELWDEFSAAFEKLTEKADKNGVMELTEPKESSFGTRLYGIKYTTGDGKTYAKDKAVSADDLLQSNTDFNGPYSHAVAINLGLQVGGVEEKTPFTKVFDDFMKS